MLRQYTNLAITLLSVSKGYGIHYTSLEATDSIPPTSESAPSATDYSTSFAFVTMVSTSNDSSGQGQQISGSVSMLVTVISGVAWSWGAMDFCDVHTFLMNSFGLWILISRCMI
jgi:hypothetical protein